MKNLLSLLPARKRFTSRLDGRIARGFAAIETLEQRIAPATFTVINVSDAGPGSLRQAILDANAATGADNIFFNIPGAGPHVIQPSRPLAPITEATLIDGYTEPGSSPNTLAVGDNAVLNIVIDGSLASSANGLVLSGGGSTVRGLAIHGFLDPSGTADSGYGLIVIGSNNTITGNFIGTDQTGTTDLGNRRDGIQLRGANTGNTIGGATPDARNVILGNGEDGIELAQTDNSANSILGNYIGTDRTGTLDRGNTGAGLRTRDFEDATIRENLISGNDAGGIVLGGGSSLIVGNRIGIGATAPPVPNTGAGIAVNGGGGHTIGDGTPEGRNTIAYNSGDGVFIARTTTSPSAIRFNDILQNGGLGIDLDGGVENAAGVTLNDAGDSDSGANDLQNFPVLTTATRTASSTVIDGTFNSTPSTIFIIEIFFAVPDPSGFGEGNSLLISRFVTTDSAGNAPFSVTSIAIPAGTALTANATRLTGSAATSEFSQVILVTDPFQVTTTLDTVNANDSVVSLREAITAANSTAGLDTITFNIPGAGVKTIAPTSALPAITDAVVIDGYSQPGASANTLAVGSNAALRIEIDATGRSNGLVIGGTGGGSTIRGLVINRASGEGILVNSGGNVIEGNFIGVDAGGSLDLGNGFGGIKIATGAGNLIGGTTPAARNVISGDNDGNVIIGGAGTPTGTIIRGNYIGTDAAGTTAVHAQAFQNAPGIKIIRGNGTIIGGADADDGTADGVVGARNVISGNGTGVLIQQGSTLIDGVAVAGNFIGVTATGLSTLGNFGDGISAFNAIQTINLVIGGTAAGAGNVISGNVGNGIQGGGLGMLVQGNRFGTDLTGTLDLGNGGAGVYIALGGSGTPNFQITVGGTTAAERNISSGNTGDGVLVTGLTSGSVAVQGNFIGTMADGITPLPNNGSGVNMNRPTIVGGPGAGQGNVIAFNGGRGVTIDFSQPVVGSRISGNSIFSNGSLGIDLNGNGVTANDLGDADDGPNALQNFPVITSVVPVVGNTEIRGTFNSTGNTAFTLEFFSSVARDPSGFGEGQTRLGTLSVTTDGSGNAPFTFLGAPGLSGFFTATATHTALGNTSEFSAAFDPLAFTVTTTLDVVNPNDGLTSLREAITAANATAGLNTITFNIPGAGVQTIAPTTPLPTISEVVIDGYSQPGASANTLAVGNNAALRIELSGASGAFNALTIQGSGSTVRGLLMNNFGGAALVLQGSGFNTIAGNWIGVDAAGNASSNVTGITINSPNNTIGGSTPAARNVIPGSTSNGAIAVVSGDSTIIQGNYIGTNAAGTAGLGSGGIDLGDLGTLSGNVISGNRDVNLIFADGVTVQGNFIGLSADGTGVLANRGGSIFLDRAQNNLIGGTTAATRNVIATSILVSGIAPGGQGNMIQGNFIGLNAAGDTAAGPFVGTAGITINGGFANIIGGTAAGAGNVIANHITGISISGEQTVLNGNFIGTNAAGTAAIPNTVGVSISGGSAVRTNMIGGNDPAERNVISGNTTDGVQVGAFGIVGVNFVQGNRIGVRADGVTALANGGNGIRVGFAGQIIGGVAVGEGNVIAFNGADGVSVTGGTGIAIRGNSIFSNNSLGIDLDPNGPTANDALDGDTGANNLQNFPVITSVASNSVSGTINSTASTTLTLDFYSNPVNANQGRVFLGSMNVTTDGSGNAPYTFTPGAAIAAGSFVTATATDGSGNTSEFSPTAAPASVFTWDGSVSTDWFTAANWTPAGVPGAADTAILDINSGIQLTSATSVATFQQSNGTFSSTAGVTFTVLESFAWTGGTQNNSAGNTVIPVGGTLTLGGGGKTLNRTLINNGTTDWTGGGVGTTVAGGAFTNNGTFNASAAANFGGVMFTNAPGAVLNQLSGTNTFFNGTFANDGAVSIGGGTLVVGSGTGGTATSTGSYAVANGAVLNFGGGTHTLNGASVSGAGNVNFTGGTTTFDATTSYTLTGTTSVTNGAAIFNIAAPVTFPNLVLSQTAFTIAGGLGGSSNMSVTGSFMWSGGRLDGAAGAITRVEPGATLTLNGTFAQQLFGRTLEVAGTANFTADTALEVSNGATINNRGLWHFQSTGDIREIGAASALSFNNLAGATLRKSGTGRSDIDIPFTNAGTVELLNDTLLFTDTFTQTAGSTALNGGALSTFATLAFNGGTLTGAGTITGDVSNTGATVRPGGTGVAGTLTVTGNYTQGAGGTLAAELGGVGAGAFDVLNVSGTTTLGGTLNIAHINAFTPASGNTFRVVQSVVNPGTFATLSGASAGKTQTAGATGLVIAQAAGGTFIWDAGAGADQSWFNPLNWNLDSGVPGAGDTAILNTNATISLPTSTSVGTFQQSTGVFIGAGAFTVLTNFVWTGGTQADTGSTIIGGTLTLSGAGVKTLETRTLINNGTTNLSGGTLLLNTATFANNGVFNAPDDADVLGNGNPFFNNNATGTLNKSGAGTTSSFVRFTNAGTVNAASGTLAFDVGLTQTAGSTVLSGGSIIGSFAFNFQGGEVRGTGTIETGFGTLNNTGAIVRPGGTGVAGTLTIGANYTQSAAGRLAVEIGGTGAGQFDVVAVTGNASLGGPLDVAFINGFTPGSSDTFRVLTAANRAGTFSVVNGTLTAQYNPTNVTLLVATANANTVVTTALDTVNAGDGVVSLREAITAANATAGTDTITFAIPGGGVKTITVSSALPALTEAAVIDGYSQPGSSANTLATGNNAVLNIVLDGVGAGSTANGLVLGAGSNASVVRGLAIMRFDAEGLVLQSDGNSVLGNFLGTDATGSVAMGNGKAGLAVRGGVGNSIGNATPAGRNVISGNGEEGIEIFGTGVSNTTVRDNYIGTDRTGTLALGNTFSGIVVAALGTTIGGTTAGSGNVISGNTLAGVQTANPGNNTTIQGNFLGVQADGVSPLGNLGGGVNLGSSAATNTLVGGPGGGNVIAYNGGNAGVRLPLGTGAVIRFNSIFSNTILGIDLGPIGVTANDAGDTDSGVNGLLNFPVLSAATAGGSNTVISGTYNGTANQTFTLEFFASSAGNASGFGEGQTVLGSTNISTDSLGNASFTFSTSTLAPGTAVSATATQTGVGTSEFSQFVLATENAATVVTTALDVVSATDGVVSLREAIIFANGISGLDTITFAIPGTGVQTIVLTSALPTITDPVKIDGYTQTGATVNTNGLGLGTNAVLRIELNGAGAGAGVNGLTITAGGSTVQGLVINRFGGDGILLSTLGGNSVLGNFIGVNAAGSAALGNLRDGVEIASGTANRIGDGTGAGRNVISGNGTVGNLDIHNGAGVGIFNTGTNNNVVSGNFIGTNATGLLGLGNTKSGVGIYDGASANTVNANVISANTGHGLDIAFSATNNTATANTIGAGVNRTTPLGNVGAGVLVNFSSTGNTIGGSSAALGNFVSANGLGGIVVGNGSSGARLFANTVSGNTGHGIEISGSAGAIVGLASPPNIVTGNTGDGIRLTGAGTTGTLVQGNFVGVTPGGTVARPNGGVGVAILNGATGSDIGGTSVGNVLAGNTGDGVRIDNADNNLVRGNRIGQTGITTGFFPNGGAGVSVNDSTGIRIGSPATSELNIIARNLGDGIEVTGNSTVTARGNIIEGNGGLGIDLGGNGVTANDLDDNDTGANTLLNFPTLTTSTRTATGTGFSYAVTGSYAGAPNTVVTIDLYANDARDASGFGEGQFLIQSFSVTTDDDGNAAFTRAFTTGATNIFGSPLGAVLSSQATLGNGASGPSSEFSNALGGTPPVQSDALFFTSQALGSRVEIRKAGNGELVRSFSAFNPAFKGGIRIASGDVNGDGFNDVIAATGDGGGARVRVFDGHNTTAGRPTVLYDFFPYGNGYRGGLFVAAGDVDGDGKAEIIVAPSAGASGLVKVFSGADGSLHSSFLAFGRGAGGVRVAAGDINGDGRADIIAGTGAGSIVRVFDGQNTANILKEFRAFPANFRGGVTVAAGDVDGDGLADIIVGAGAGSNAVRTFFSRDAGGMVEFNAFAGVGRGINVSTTDFNGDGIADIIAAQGRGSAARVRVFEGGGVVSGAATAAYTRPVFAFDPAYVGGVFVG